MSFLVLRKISQLWKWLLLTCGPDILCRMNCKIIDFSINLSSGSPVTQLVNTVASQRGGLGWLRLFCVQFACPPCAYVGSVSSYSSSFWQHVQDIKHHTLSHRSQGCWMSDKSTIIFYLLRQVLRSISCQNERVTVLFFWSMKISQTLIVLEPISFRSLSQTTTKPHTHIAFRLLQAVIV